MRFGTNLPYAGPLATTSQIVEFAQIVEDLGFHHVRAGEHLVFPRRIDTPYPYSADGKRVVGAAANQLELFTTFAFVAAQTTTLRFQTGVLLLPLREVFAVAKATATLDYLSGGRFVLEVGVGWMRDEFEILGVPFQRRGRITDEKIAVLRALLAGRTPYAGVGYEVPALDFQPLPVQQPFPLHIGSGAGEVPLRRVAEFADGWTPIGVTDEDFRVARDRLASLMEQRGRDVSILDIQGRIDLSGADAPDPRRVARELEELQRRGYTSVHIDLGALRAERLGDVLRKAELYSPVIRSLS